VKRDVLLVPFGASWAAIRDGARRAEDAGYDGVWLWDHLRGGNGAGPAPVPECWTALSALAALTSRVSLGPLVLNVANRHPGVLANMAATLQEVSGGRLVLGLGAGGSLATPYADEQVALGRPVGTDTERRREVERALAQIRGLWAGDPPGFLRPSPPPPLVVAGFGPKMAALAGRLGDGFNTAAGHPQLPELVAAAREAHAKSGRSTPFEISVFGGFPGTEAGRKRLAGLAVERLIVLLQPPYDELRPGGTHAHLSDR
jgi:alkanesulfonate monooxygenase SsuD/methylene tetrahydromethanopterin reductase-like flavin-dependent oxidoreductase (luciferase family)